MTPYARVRTWLAGGTLAKAGLASQAVAVTSVADLAAQLTASTDAPVLGPGTPLAPAHQETREPRRFDYQSGRNINARPRAYEPIGFASLRNLCSQYDVARIAIETRKDEVRGWDWDVRVKPVSGLTREEQKARASTFADTVARVKGFLESPNQEDDFGTWLMQYLEDLFVIDAPTIFLRQTRGGELYSAEIIDGSTIQILIDEYGRQPRLPGAKPPAPHTHLWQFTGDGALCTVCGWPSAYAQVIKGMPWVGFAAYEMLYVPYHQSADSPYGTPPIYWVLLAVNRALRRQSLDLSLFNEGTMPPAFYKLPEGWDVHQIEELQELFDTLLSGDDRARAKLRFVPGGNGAGLERINPEPKPEVEQWLMHVTAAAFGTSAYELGFEPDSGLGGAGFGEASRSSAEKRGAKPLSRHLAKVINRVIAGPLNQPELEFVWRGLGQSEDLLKEAQRDEVYWKIGAKATDEIREDVLGLDAIGLGPSVFDPKIGVVLVKDLLANAAATAGAAAALTADALDPTESPIDAEEAGASDAKVPSANADETVAGETIGEPALGKVALERREMSAWQRKAVRALKNGRSAIVPFETDTIDRRATRAIQIGLSTATTPEEVRDIFAKAAASASADRMRPNAVIAGERPSPGHAWIGDALLEADEAERIGDAARRQHERAIAEVLK